MELSEKEIQELKEKKISIENLYDKYFYTQKDGVNVENILKLLNENICSFQEIVDKFKNIEDDDNDPSLYRLLRNKELFEELIQINKLNREDLRYLLNKIGIDYELHCLSRNTNLLKYTVDSVSFKELVDKFKSINYTYASSCLYRLLWNEGLFKELIQNNRLNKDDLRYLLNKIDAWSELDSLCDNAPLIKHILNEFVLNKEDVDKFNTMIEKDEWRKKHSIPALFELINFHETHEWTQADDWYERAEDEIDQELLNLNELNKYTYSFDLNKDQRDELIEVLRNNEIARNKLFQIIDNNLESNYSFDSLMDYLKKPEKKSILNI